MKKKPLTLIRIFSLMVYTYVIYLIISLGLYTFELYKKKYLLRNEGVIIKAYYAKLRPGKSGKSGIPALFTYRFNWNGEKYESVLRQGVDGSVGDSIDFVILPANPECNASKYWVYKPYYIPIYW